MWQQWNTLNPDQQAAVIGGVVAILFYLARLVRPAWFEDGTTVAKWQRTAVAFGLSVATAIANSISQGQPITGAVILSWLLAYASAEAAHTVISRTTALR